jgi:hypothetical protein
MMRTHVKIERFLTAVVMSPLLSIERKERERILDQRLKRAEQRQKKR